MAGHTSSGGWRLQREALTALASANDGTRLTVRGRCGMKGNRSVSSATRISVAALTDPMIHQSGARDDSPGQSVVAGGVRAEPGMSCERQKKRLVIRYVKIYCESDEAGRLCWSSWEYR
jgi:hypothetical protein